MNNKMDYKVIIANTLEGLVKGVNIELKKGWKCQGGVEICDTNGMLLEYHQAIVK